MLYICHNHPSVRPGGVEIYALELYQAVRQSDEFEPWLLARCGPPDIRMRPSRRLSMFGDDSNQYLFFTDLSEFDSFYGTTRERSICTKYLREFLSACQPDIVHIQHTLFLGYDVLRLIKELLPTTPIVYTLHEYVPICHQNGQMTLRTLGNENCLEASPRRCNECFPTISPQRFVLRKQSTQAYFSLVDLFIAPSKFLLERYVDWGIPREKIRFEDYGRRLLPIAPRPSQENGRRRNRIGFFGQVNPFKGVDVLLKAMKILGAEGCDVHLWLHGANLEFQAREFQNQIRKLLAATRQNVTMAGSYVHSNMPKLMEKVDWVVVPSIWWENSPLVIQEAFHHGRPVICSNIGGMAEKVRDGIDGLHFSVRDPFSLAQVIRRATETPRLWQKLHQGISNVYKIEDHVTTLTDIYRALIAKKLGDAVIHEKGSLDLEQAG